MNNRSATYANLEVGDPAPWFHQRSTSNANYAFDTVAGRYVVLCFYISAADPVGQSITQSVMRNRDIFDDDQMCFFGVSMDPADEQDGRVRESMPGVRFFWDFDGKICRNYGAAPKESGSETQIKALRFWLVLDPTLRVLAKFPIVANDDDTDAVFTFLRALPPADRHTGFEVPAPILLLPNVFEPQLCRKLIEIYERDGGEESDFMREVNGKTVHVLDHNHKRRKDCMITAPDIIKIIQSHIFRRIHPEVRKIYSFDATRMERYLVGCYAAEDNAHFRAHRDNTTKGTAHRRFAVSINLNDEFDGGEVSFPEYGRRNYKAPPGGAVVFPCALLHAVSRVTRGRRYAFLPFLYDEEAARIREANDQFLEGGGTYRAGIAPRVQ